jgi:hypothetical protein
MNRPRAYSGLGQNDHIFEYSRGGNQIGRRSVNDAELTICACQITHWIVPARSAVGHENPGSSEETSGRFGEGFRMISGASAEGGSRTESGRSPNSHWTGNGAVRDNRVDPAGDAIKGERPRNVDNPVPMSNCGAILAIKRLPGWRKGLADPALSRSRCQEALAGS